MSTSKQGPAEYGYNEWQRLLAEAFFSRPGIPVVLFAADDELDRMAPAAQGSSGAESLACAVLPFVRLNEGGNIFASLRGLRAVWRRDPAGPPPTLPVLALTVLAATRMRRDTQASAANYYLRMAQALLPGGDAGEVETARWHMRAAFESDVVPMWRELHDWMCRSDGEFGISTVRSHPHWTNIGYPLSQALVRASDKALLTRFFAAIGVADRGVPAEAALLSYLRLWAARHQTLSGTLRSALEDESLSEMLAPIIAGLAASWDGHVVTPEGRRHLDVRLVLDVDDWQGQWVLAGGGQRAGLTLSGRVGGRECSTPLKPPAFGQYATLTGAPVPTGAAVEEGFRLHGDGVTAEFPPSRLVALRQDADAGGWVSCDGVEPYCELLLAVHPELVGTVRAALSGAAHDGWRTLEQKPGDPLLKGFAIFRKVRFSDPDRLNKALAALPAEMKRVLRPAVTARPRLGSGLPLVRSVAHGCYLAGGEPDLLLPVAEEPRHVTAVFDGVSEQFKATGFPIPLRIMPGIEPGEHRIEADGESLRFTVLRRSPADGPAAGTGSLSWKADSGVLAAGPCPAGICGANAPECTGESEPLLVRRGASESWWLHRDGTCTRAPEPAPAPLLASVGLQSMFYEADRPESAAWLVQKRRLGWAPPILLRRLAPEFRRMTPEATRVWAQLTGPAAPAPGDAEAGLWALYARAWRLARER